MDRKTDEGFPIAHTIIRRYNRYVVTILFLEHIVLINDWTINPRNATEWFCVGDLPRPADVNRMGFNDKTEHVACVY